jgi:hypothetical protein
MAASIPVLRVLFQRTRPSYRRSNPGDRNELGGNRHPADVPAGTSSQNLTTDGWSDKTVCDGQVSTVRAASDGGGSVQGQEDVISEYHTKRLEDEMHELKPIRHEVL